VIGCISAGNKRYVDVGTQASDEMSSAIERLAVYIANLFFLTSDVNAPVLKDKDLTEELAGQLSCVQVILSEYTRHFGHVLHNFIRLALHVPFDYDHYTLMAVCKYLIHPEFNYYA